LLTVIVWARRRLRDELFPSLRWEVFERPRRILPVVVLRNLFAAPRCDFIFGMRQFLTVSVSGAG
jgi:hypothetical protein